MVAVAAVVTTFLQQPCTASCIHITVQTATVCTVPVLLAEAVAAENVSECSIVTVAWSVAWPCLTACFGSLFRQSWLACTGVAVHVLHMHH